MLSSSHNSKLLVTTALESTWMGDEVVFLGEWCRRYDRKEVWGNFTHIVLPYHWDDRNKLRRDYDFLKKLHDDLLGHLSEWLNKVHGVAKSMRYWQTIIDPWLLSYVAVLYDRWAMIGYAFEQNPSYAAIMPGDVGDENGVCDYNDFMMRVVSDEWNHKLYADILRYQYASRCDFLGCDSCGDSKEIEGGQIMQKSFFLGGFNIKGLLKLALGSLCGLQQDIMFYQSYMDKRFAFAFLNIDLGQFPCIFDGRFDFDVSNACSTGKNDVIRAGLKWDVHGYDDVFEEYLMSRILGDIPIAYVEGYYKLLLESSKIQVSPRVIVTAVAHWGNALFKVWSAEKVEHGAKFVVAQHGGSINIGSRIAMEFEEDVADYYATPSRYGHAKHVRLPFVKPIIRAKTTRGWCSLLGFDQPRYAYRLQDSPIAGQTLSCYSQTTEFFYQLSAVVKKSFRIKPYPHDGWGTKQRYADELGLVYIDATSSFHAFLSSSRLIVCTYPNTTFAEAMGSGIPVIMLYRGDLWELPDWMLPLVEQLIRVRIVFYDARQAARHVNSVWGNIDQWWGSSEVLSVRHLFEDQAVYFGRERWTREWSSFLQSIVK